MSILGWWLASGAACNFIASLILSIVVLWYPEYHIQNWHQWLVYLGLVWLAVALNAWGSQLLPLYNRFNCERLDLMNKKKKKLINTPGSPRRLYHPHRNNHHPLRMQPKQPRRTYVDIRPCQQQHRLAKRRLRPLTSDQQRRIRIPGNRLRSTRLRRDSKSRAESPQGHPLPGSYRAGHRVAVCLRLRERD